MRGEHAGGGVAYSLVATPVAGKGLGARLNSAAFAATVAPSDYAGAAAGTYTDTIELSLRHAISHHALAVTQMTLRLDVDSSRAR